MILYLSYLQAADLLYMIPHRLSLLCVIDNIILSRQKRDYTVNSLLLDLGYWHVKQLLLLLST